MFVCLRNRFCLCSSANRTSISLYTFFIVCSFLRYSTVVKCTISSFNLATITSTSMLVFVSSILHPPAETMYVFGWSHFCNYEIGKATCFKWDFSVSHSRNKIFYRVIWFYMEHKVVIHLNVWDRNRNIYLTVRLYLCAIFHNIDIENIYVTVFIVVLIGNCRKNFFSFLRGCRNFVAYQGRAFFKATAVNNDTVFVFKHFNLLIARRKGKCKNSDHNKKYCCQ